MVGWKCRARCNATQYAAGRWNRVLMGLQAVRSLILLSGDGAEGGFFFHEHMCILEHFFLFDSYHSSFQWVWVCMNGMKTDIQKTRVAV